MDKKQFQHLKNTITQINQIVKSVDPAIKGEVFDILKPLIDITRLHEHEAGKGTDFGTGHTSKSVREFYTKHNPDKPAKRVRIMTAWIYSRRGANPFSLKEIDELFDEVGVGRPNRLDMTIKNALEKGHNLFQSAGHGKYRPTVHGENYFKEKLGVKPPRS